MPNPLDPIKDNHENTYETFKVAKICLSSNDPTLKSTIVSTKFSGLSKQDSLNIIYDAEDQLEYLTVLALFSTFERRLRDALASYESYLKIDAAKRPSSFPAHSSASAIQKNIVSFYRKKCNYLGVRDLLEIFVPDVDQSTIDNDVWPIKKYRDWIAHGRSSSGSTPTTVFASDAYHILTDFLTQAGLI